MSKYNLNTLNLRDFQEAIERGEYSTFPVYEWMKAHEANPGNEPVMVICPYDGTLYRTLGQCPSPYHPRPKPRPSGRIFQWIVFIPAIIAFTYSLLNNQALVDLIATALLLIITSIVFTLLLAFVIWIWAKLSPESVVRGVRLAGHLVSILSGFFAMMFVAIIQGKFPPLVWWVIEFVVAFVLENNVTVLVARLVFRYVLPGFEFSEPADSLEKLVQDCANKMVPGIPYRLLFFASCLSVGLWLFTPALFDGNLPPIWMVPFILAPYAVWLWKFYERFFDLMQRPELKRLKKEDPDVSLRVDLLVTALMAIIRPTEIERKRWWQMLLFYISILLPPGGWVASIVILGL